MRRTLTLFSRSGVATAATASALSILATVTLVTWGIVVSRVVASDRDRVVAALPALGPPLGPIVLGEGTERGGRPAGGVGPGVASHVSGPQPSGATAGGPQRTDSPVDVERVSGTVAAALDAQAPGRMEEVGTIERIESIIKDSNEGHATTEDDGTGVSDESDPGDSDDRLLVGDVDPVPETIVATDEPATELPYSGTAAGSASPSA